MLIKRSEHQARRGSLAAAFAGQSQGGLDRRAFLRRSGLTVGALAAVGALPLASVRKAEAAGSMVTSGATAAAAVPLASPAQADTETNDEKRKARYKETDHVKTFYRVNRYPS